MWLPSRPVFLELKKIHSVRCHLRWRGTEPDSGFGAERLLEWREFPCLILPRASFPSFLPSALFSAFTWTRSPIVGGFISSGQQRTILLLQKHSHPVIEFKFGNIFSRNLDWQFLLFLGCSWDLRSRRERRKKLKLFAINFILSINRRREKNPCKKVKKMKRNISQFGQDMRKRRQIVGYERYFLEEDFIPNWPQNWKEFFIHQSNSI